MSIFERRKQPRDGIDRITITDVSPLRLSAADAVNRPDPMHQARHAAQRIVKAAERASVQSRGEIDPHYLVDWLKNELIQAHYRINQLEAPQHGHQHRTRS